MLWKYIITIIRYIQSQDWFYSVVVLLSILLVGLVDLLCNDISTVHHCSYDGVPFLLHDATFKRTTNIDDVFPKLVDVDACWLNMSQIKQLDAGSWFLRVSIHYPCLKKCYYPGSLLQ